MVTTIARSPAKPFLKWAGGKSRLLEALSQHFPPELSKGHLHTYVEPFIGSGAVFFHIAQSFPIQAFVISDINHELIVAYTTIQQTVEELITILTAWQQDYLTLDEAERREYFLQIRADFNRDRAQLSANFSTAWIQRTAQLIFLNRTCFNGLFRVNTSGDFNAPFGRYKQPRICHTEKLRAAAQVLEQTQIFRGDFTACEAAIDAQSFVYFDPPYRPISKTANFNAYSTHVFNDSEQLRLRDFFRRLDQRGAKLLLSNSDPQNEDIGDRFFDNAYQDYRIERIQASRCINSNIQKRGPISEILVANY
ncbi:MAG: DNA adenine methylase [Spirulinaceae cyanobacterium RM2_2_10]|nr:DNA adenine methylase [Spirulinaceae cyanobacterium SM2_1_0]NJO20866.1 DNA adenine methylase [Spirulinaceae cyanobacterium RM2_2_10]